MSPGVFKSPSLLAIQADISQVVFHCQDTTGCFFSATLHGNSLVYVVFLQQNALSLSTFTT